MVDVGVAGDVATRAHYVDPHAYSHRYRARVADIEFYSALVQPGMAVLEYGAGNGRVTRSMVAAGAQVTATDLSEAMLEDLRASVPPNAVETIAADMRELRLTRRFPLVIAAFNTVQHLYTVNDFRRFFEGVRSHLEPGGRFVFDYEQPRPEDLAAEDVEYDVQRQVLLMFLEFETPDGSIVRAPLSHRQIYPQELEALLALGGLRVESVSPDFQRDGVPDEAISLAISAVVD